MLRSCHEHHGHPPEDFEKGGHDGLDEALDVCVSALAVTVAEERARPRGRERGTMSEQRVYLDYNASTPIAPEAVEAMRPFLTEHYGNPSSHHWAGAPEKAAVDRAREQVARILGCSADEVVFTSGGSESNNHALKGVFFANPDRGGHIVTSAVEHPAVLKPLRFLQALGAEVAIVPVDRFDEWTRSLCDARSHPGQFSSR